MSANQIIRPDIQPPVDGRHPVLGKLRRKLGLTYILSNPFKVPVNRLPGAPVTSAEARAPKTGSPANGQS